MYVIYRYSMYLSALATCTEMLQTTANGLTSISLDFILYSSVYLDADGKVFFFYIFRLATFVRECVSSGFDSILLSSFHLSLLLWYNHRRAQYKTRNVASCGKENGRQSPSTSAQLFVRAVQKLQCNCEIIYNW